MEKMASHMDIETLINERHYRHEHLMKDLDSVMDVLLSFCEQAEWMMEHEYRIGELIGEVIVASTEVEHVLPRTEQYFEEYQRMLLPAINRQKPKNFDKVLGKIKGILPRLKPYCDNINKDEEGLNKFRNGEVELTNQLNDKYIAHYEIAIENLTAAVSMLERHIIESQKKHNSISKDIICLQFDTMFRQYCLAKKDELTEFFEEIEDIATARSELIAAYQTSGLYVYYHQHKNRPDYLVRALKSDNKLETALLIIFDIKARMDVLQKYKRGEKNDGDERVVNEQPENLVFKKNYNGRPIDFFTIRKYLEVKQVKDIKHKYEWYSGYRIFDDLKLLEELKLTSYAEQMNTWFPDAKVPCDADALGDYATGHTGKNYNLWDEETFLNEMKNNQSKKGFRKLSGLCHDIKDAMKKVPTLNLRDE